MGGGVMGPGAKVAGVGIITNSFRRGAQVIPQSVEHSVMSVAPSCSASSAIAFSSGEVSSVADMKASANHSVSWEMMNDWEFHGGAEEEVAPLGSIDVSGRGEPMARVLFSGVPSVEETKEATTYLKDALEGLYLSSPKSADTAQVSRLSNPEETRDCVARNVKAISVPQPAMQAFKLLNQSSAVQSVVASIAADQKVWDAVMNNPTFMGFIHSLKTNDDFVDQGFSQSSESSDEKEECFDGAQHKDSGNPDSGFLKNIKTGMFKMVSKAKNITTSVVNKMVSKVKDTKIRVIEVVSKSTDFVEYLFTSPSAEKEKENAGSNNFEKTTDFVEYLFTSPSAEKEEENAGSNNIEKTIAATIMGLVMMVIMVVLLKRV